MLKHLALTALTLSSVSVFASDIELVKSLLPKGEIIAQTKASEEGAESNFIVADLNQDGLEDVLVISEEQDAEFPDRFLKLYLGSKNGTLKLQFSNADVVRTSDEGGVFGDPLSGLELKKSGAVTLSHFGGSAWKWAYKDTFQFRKGNFVVIGQDSSMFNPMAGEESKSINLLTSQVVETSQKDGDSPVKTKKYRIAVKPLVKVANYKGQE